MPQEINIFQCYKCLMFQTQIVKKSKTWTCVVCHEKQSLKKSFGQGNGKACRERVQQLNLMRQNAEEFVPELDYEQNEDESHGTYEDVEDVENNDQRQVHAGWLPGQISNDDHLVKKESRWTKYLDPPVQQEDSDEN